MMKTVLVPGAPWPEFTPRQPVGRPPKVLASSLPGYLADLYRVILRTPGVTTKELAAMHAMTTQHTSRRLNLLLHNQLIRVVHIKVPKRKPTATFYAKGAVCGAR